MERLYKELTEKDVEPGDLVINTLDQSELISDPAHCVHLVYCVQPIQNHFMIDIGWAWINSDYTILLKDGKIFLGKCLYEKMEEK